MLSAQKISALQVQGAVLVFLSLVSFYWIHESGEARKVFAPGRASQNQTLAADEGHIVAAPVAFPIDLNRATPAEFEALPGVGPAIAQRILEYKKQRGVFHNAAELKNVKGIGPKTFEKIAPLISVP